MAVLLGIVLPFCFQERLGSLKWVSTLSVCVVLLNISMMVGYSFYLQGKGGEAFLHDPLAAAVWDAQGIFRAAGAVAFAFTPMLNLFSVLKETPEPRQVKKAARISTFVCFSGYLLIGLVVFSTFRAATQSNCIYNVLPPDRDAFRLPWLMLVMCIT